MCAVFLCGTASYTVRYNSVEVVLTCVLFSCGTIYYTVQGGSEQKTPCVWPFFKKKVLEALSFGAVIFFPFSSFWQSYQVCNDIKFGIFWDTTAKFRESASEN